MSDTEKTKRQTSVTESQIVASTVEKHMVRGWVMMDKIVKPRKHYRRLRRLLAAQVGSEPR